MTARNTVQWTREPGARITGSRDLDRSKVQAPGIVRDPDGGFRLFYTGVGPARPFDACQGYILSAYSRDGLTFATDAGIRVAPDPQVLHSSRRLLAPTVVALDDGRWRMYYESRGPVDLATVICSAVSSDLIQWNVEPGIRLSTQGGVGGPSFVTLPDGSGSLFCFASEFDAAGPAGGRRISQSVISAVTEDGLDFHLEGYRMRDRYSLQEDIGITAADVIVPTRKGQPWVMLYSAWQDVPAGAEVPRHPSHADVEAGESEQIVDFAAASIASDLAGYRSRIFTAWSDDGLYWERAGCVLEGAGYGQPGIDAIHAEDMSLIRLDDGGFRMYYAACDNDGNWRIASARTGPME